MVEKQLWISRLTGKKKGRGCRRQLEIWKGEMLLGPASSGAECAIFYILFALSLSPYPKPNGVALWGWSAHPISMWWLYIYI
jgi:hypothetical protein